MLAGGQDSPRARQPPCLWHRSWGSQHITGAQK